MATPFDPVLPVLVKLATDAVAQPSPGAEIAVFVGRSAGKPVKVSLNAQEIVNLAAQGGDALGNRFQAEYVSQDTPMDLDAALVEAANHLGSVHPGKTPNLLVLDPVANQSVTWTQANADVFNQQGGTIHVWSPNTPGAVGDDVLAPLDDDGAVDTAAPAQFFGAGNLYPDITAACQVGAPAEQPDPLPAGVDLFQWYSAATEDAGPLLPVPSAANSAANYLAYSFSVGEQTNIYNTHPGVWQTKLIRENATDDNWPDIGSGSETTLTTQDIGGISETERAIGLVNSGSFNIANIYVGEDLYHNQFVRFVQFAQSEWQDVTINKLANQAALAVYIGEDISSDPEDFGGVTSLAGFVMYRMAKTNNHPGDGTSTSQVAADGHSGIALYTDTSATQVVFPFSQLPKDYGGSRGYGVVLLFSSTPGETSVAQP